MEAPSEQSATSHATTDYKFPDPATSIKCKHCNRHFATISVEGGLVPYINQEQACALCEPFLGLYDTLQTRGQEHTALLDRGQKHHGRALAHDRFRNARVALENFLISVEAPNEASFDVAQAGFANRADPVQLERTDDPVEAPNPEKNQQGRNGVSPPDECMSPTQSSPTVKRKLTRGSSASNLERKRIKFTETVEERPEYRGTLEFYRGCKEYVPGRYVAAEGSEYLDTSGSTLTFAKFTGQKKVGSTFVDIVPKEEARKGDGGLPAAKRKGKANGNKKQGDEQEPRPEPEKNATKMNSRELRNTTRSRSTTPPATTRTRRKIAQYDGQDDEATEGSLSIPSLVAVLKASCPAKAGGPADGGRSTRPSKSIEEHQRSSGDTIHGDAAKEAAEAVNINKAVLIIQRELSDLQKATVTPRYSNLVSTAVRSFFEVLEPLKALVHTKPNKAEESGDVLNEDSIYLEALDATVETASTETLHLTEDMKQNEDGPIWTGAEAHSEKTSEVNACPALDANVLDFMPKGGKQNVSGMSELVKIENDQSQHRDLPVPTVEAVLSETFIQAKEKCITKPRSPTARRSGEAARRLSTQSRDLPGLDAELRRRSRRTSSMAPPDYQTLTPLYTFEEASARPTARNLREPRLSLSRKSPTPFLTAVADDEEFGERDKDLNERNTDKSNKISTSEQNSHARVTEVPKAKVNNAPSKPADKPLVANSTLSGGGNTIISHDNGSTQQGPELRVEPTLQVSPSKLFCNEAAESLHQRISEVISGRDGKQGTHTQSQSEATNGSPQASNINQDLGTTPAGSGRVSKESKVHITVTDRRGAEEAQVDPDTAHDSAQVETIDDRDLSADPSYGNNIETFDEEMHDAVEQSLRSPRKMFGDEAKMKMAVEIPRDHRTAASEVGGTGIEGNRLDRVVEIVVCPAAKEASPRHNRRRS